MTIANGDDNFEHFRDALSASIIAKLSQDVKGPRKRRSKGRKNSIEQATETDVENSDESVLADLSDFVEYLAEEVYPALPDELHAISYAVVQDDVVIAEKYSLPLDRSLVSTIVERFPPSIADSLCSYGLIDEASALDRFLEPALNSFMKAATAAPPQYTPAITATRPDGCEICGREQLQLTYHHLIPRQIHAKAVKRGWHKEWQLHKVCWLCRACHSYVHRVATNEELAKDYYDVELLLAREDIQKWAAWAGKIRWKAR